MADMVAWCNTCLYEVPWPLLTATEFVFRFLAIHPFQDGNRRIGRALFLLALLQPDDDYLVGLMPYVALDRRIEQNHAQYYSVLHGVVFLKMLEGAVEDVERYRQCYTLLQKLSETATVVLQTFKSRPEQRLRVNEIVAATDLPRRTIQYALKTLTE